MIADATPYARFSFETSRLLLRPWRVAEATVLRELWTERDPRVSPHRRIDSDGHPTLAELEDSIRTNQPLSTIGLLAIERKAARGVIGYCGLVECGRGSEGEPELAFRGIRHLESRLGDDLVAGYVLHTGKETLPFGPKFRAVPVSALWQV